MQDAIRHPSVLRICLGALLALAIAACTDSSTSQQMPADPTGGLPADSEAAPGAEIYKREKCSRCHQIGGVGGKLGPALGGVGERRDREWMRAYMRDPGSKVAKPRMPPVKVPDAELEALLDYMESLE